MSARGNTETLLERERRDHAKDEADRLAKKVCALRKRRGIYLPSREQDRVSLAFQLALGAGLICLGVEDAEETQG